MTHWDASRSILGRNLVAPAETHLISCDAPPSRPELSDDPPRENPAPLQSRSRYRRARRHKPVGTEAEEHQRPDRHRPRDERAELDGPPQAGADLQDPPVAGGKGRSDLRGRR